MLHYVLENNYKKKPEKTAVIHDGKKYTYKQVLLNSRKFAKWLDENLNPKAKIGIILDNSIETIYSIYGLSIAGRVSVPLDTDMSKNNLNYIIHDAAIELFIISSKYLDKIESLKEENNFEILLVDINKNCNKYNNMKDILLKVKSNKFCIQSQKDTDLSSLLYTTGTTGPKKGVKLSHKNLLEATKNINEFMEIGHWAVESLPMRLSHSFGFARLRCVFDVCGTVILENGFLRPEKILCNMKKYNANAISSVPAGFAILLEYYLDQFKEISFDIRYIEIGSAFMRRKHKDLLMSLCSKARICMHYGLTEASRSTFIEFHSERDYLHTIGKPSPNVKIKIVDDNGKKLPANKKGEIIIKGKMVTKGYLNKDSVTKSSIINGWIYTGDIGMFDNENYIHLLGRKKDIINVGGLKVAPGEVEEVLLQYPGIVEVGVAGKRTDDINYENVIAFIVTENNDIDEARIKKFCMENLEPYKIPSKILTVNILPTTKSGKIQRYILRNKLKGVNYN